MEIPKNVLYIIVIIICFLILSRTIYLHVTNQSSSNITENFTSNVRNIVNKVQDLGTNNSSKYSWSNSLMNINSTNVKPISFWHPTPPLNYVKLGDMISIDPEFKAPKDKALFVNGEVKKPIDYKQLVSIGTAMASTGVASYISNKQYLDNAITKFTTISNTLNSYNGLISGLKTRIYQKMKENYYKTNFLQIVKKNTVNNTSSVILNQNLFSLSPENFIYDKNGPLTNASYLQLGGYVEGDRYIVNIPANYKIGLVRTHLTLGSQFTRVYEIPDIDIVNLDLSKDKESEKKKDIFDRYLKPLSDEQFLTFKNTDNKFQYVRSLTEDDVNFNKNNIVNLFELLTNEEIYSGLEIAKAEVDDFIQKFPDIKFRNYFKAKLYNFLTDLDNLINRYAINYVSTSVSLEMYFPNLFEDYGSYNYTFVIYEYDNTNKKIDNSIKRINPDQFDITKSESVRRNIDNNFNDEYYISLQNNLLNDLSTLKTVRDKINNNQEILPPLTIFKPIPPPGYKVLGHIFGDNTDDVNGLLNSTDPNKTVACIPEHCVKDVRPWERTDMVFEYSKGSTYFAIYYNPVCGTFHCVNNRNEMPEGKVSKIVACVEKCKVVDELIKSDECARNFLDKNKTIIANTPSESTITADLEDAYFVDKITEKSKQITKLESKARQLQLLNDKADIINRERNKDKLQNYVDNQRRNINSIADRLKNDRYKIDVNVDITVERLNKLLNEIENSSLSANQKRYIKDSILANKGLKDSGMMSRAEFNAKLNQIVSSCPNIDLSGLVKKSTVADVCYGCDNP